MQVNIHIFDLKFDGKFLCDEEICKIYGKTQATLVTNVEYFIQQCPKRWIYSITIIFEDYVRLQSDYGIFISNGCGFRFFIIDDGG